MSRSNYLRDILLITLFIFSFYFISLHNYLLFHTSIELISIIVAFSLFTIAWNSRDFNNNNYLLFLGIAFLFIGSIDLLHTLQYKGMNIFASNNANPSTQLWIIARYQESITFLVATYYINRKFKAKVVFSVYLIVSILLVSLVFTNIFPACFVEGSGLTLFKKISEYIISLILLIALWRYHKQKAFFIPRVRWMIYFSIILTILSEISFTFYISVYGLSNFVGHIFKLVSFYLLYKALIVSSLKKPYQLLFNDLQLSEKRYRKAQEIGQVGNWEYNPQTDIFWGSDEAKRIYGFDPKAANFTTEEVESCIEDRENVHKALVDLIEKDIPYDLEFQILTKDKAEPRYIQSQAVVERDASGNPLKVTGVIQDITLRKKTERKILEAQADMKSLLENSKVSFVLINRDFTIRAFNNKANLNTQKVFDKEIQAGDSILDFTVPENKDAFLQNFNHCLQGHTVVVDMGFPIQNPQFWFNFSYDPVKDDAGKVVGVLFSTLDITERMQAELDLKVKMEHLHRLNHAMLGRENRIIELKQEINELSLKCGLEAPYSMDY